MNNFINIKDISSKNLRKILIDAKRRKLKRKKLKTLESDLGQPLKGKLLIQVLSIYYWIIILLYVQNWFTGTTPSINTHELTERFGNPHDKIKTRFFCPSLTTIVVSFNLINCIHVFCINAQHRTTIVLRLYLNFVLFLVICTLRKIKRRFMKRGNWYCQM